MIIVFLLGVLVGSMIIPRVVESFSAYANQGLLLRNELNNMVNIRAIDNQRNIFRDTTLTDLNVSSSRNNLTRINKTTAVVMTEQELNNYLVSMNITSTNMGKFYNEIINRNIVLPTSINHFVVYIVKEGDTYKALKITDIPNIEKIVNPNLLNRLRQTRVYKNTEIEINKTGELYNIRLVDKETNAPMNALHNNIKRTYGVDYIPFVVLRLE
jgi:hypothetical protein